MARIAIRLGLVILPLLCADTARAATGISALGVLQDLLVLAFILIGVVLIGFIGGEIGTRRQVDIYALPRVLFSFGCLYLFLAILLYYNADPRVLLIVLGLVICLLMVGLTWVLPIQGRVRVIVLTGVVTLIVTTISLWPRVLALHDRVYVDNFSELPLVDFSVPGYWRVMELSDGRRLLNLSEYKPTGKLFDDGRRRFKSPAVFTPTTEGESAGRIDVFVVRVARTTEGAWGWEERPDISLSLPVFGRVEVPRFELNTVGEALLLSGSTSIDPTFLYEAVAERHTDAADRSAAEDWIVELIDLGCDVDYVDPVTGASVLTRAIRTSPTRIVERMLRAGADPNFVNARNGRTPLHVAAVTRLSVTQILLEYGANPQVTDLDGQTPAESLRSFSTRHRGSSGSSSDSETTERILRLLERRSPEE